MNLDNPVNLALYALDPVRFAIDLLEFRPDPVQVRVLDPTIRWGILNCTRQWGKSTVVAIKALHHALFRPNSTTVIAAPCERQSAETLAKVASFLRLLPIRTRTDGRNRHSIQFPDGARIVALPGVERTVRGISEVSLMLIDEASRVDDNLYHALRPMIAMPEDASLWLLSTPNGRQGFFWEEWSNPAVGPENGGGWTRISVKATDCPRFRRDFLENERNSKGEEYFAQEYLCAFTQSDHLLFNPESIRTAYRDDIPWIFDSAPEPRAHETVFYIGVDLGQSRDHTTIAILERRTVDTGRRNPVNWEPLRETQVYLRHIERIPLNTSYVDVVERLADYAKNPKLASKSTIVMDATGVGKPVYDMLKFQTLPAILVPATITAGSRATTIGRRQNIPRADLLNSLEGMLRRRELGITTHAPGSGQLRDELARFSLKKDSRDDLLFASALAVWQLQNQPQPIDGVNPLPGIVPMFEY